MKPWGGFQHGLGLRFAILSAGVLACALGSLLLFRSHGGSTVVTGRVLGVDGKPIGGASVYIQSSRVQGLATSLQIVSSAPDGAFRFHVADFHARTEIYARLPGRGVGLFRFDPDSWSGGGGSLRDVPVVLRLGPARRLTARVIDWSGKPVARVSVVPMLIGGRFQPSPAVRRALGV